MSSGSVNFALVGFGAWGRFHAQSIAGTPGAKLSAIVAPSESSRTEAKKLHPDAKIFSDHRAMLAEVKPEAVDIVTPSHTHREVCTDALNAGAHVLLEKPMALSVADCRAMNELAKAKGQSAGHRS